MFTRQARSSMKFLFAAICCMMLTNGLAREQDSCDGEPGSVYKAPPKHFNIILIGATGDLAQKYLWNGLYELFKKYRMEDKVAFTFYGCGRRNSTEIGSTFSQILLNVEHCTDSACRNTKTKFIESTQYHQLKKESDYESLGRKIGENTQTMYGLDDHDWNSEEGRIVYLSVPPAAYSKTAQLVHKHLRPSKGRAWFRIVIEKPFGNNFKEAETLAENLQKYFKEEEIYRIDHYLGKHIVQAVLPFRTVNAQLYEPIWNRNYIERVEVVMKEELSVKGRTSFYDGVGVMRDVMQNHLTEMLSLIGMDLPQKSSSIKDVVNNKVKFVRQLASVKLSNAVLGQYQGYQEAFQEESKQDDLTKTSTFAAVLLSVNSARWKDVPFLLMSGKNLDEKASYIRVIFKNNTFSVSSPGSTYNNSQLVFYISGNNMNKPPMVFVSKSLPKPKAPNGYKFSEWVLDYNLFGETMHDGHQLITVAPPKDAYSSLLEAVFQGQRNLFTSSKFLMASWKAWSDFVEKADKEQPLVYATGKDCCKDLDFVISGKTLKFTNPKTEQVIHLDSNMDNLPIASIPPEFFGSRLVCNNTDDVIREFARNIYTAALASIADSGSFHFALSGGSTPLALYSYLVQEFLDFPWDKTHVWLVDERCVALEAKGSNFKAIYESMLRESNIPYVNIHPMPIDLGPETCDETFHGDQLYAFELQKYLVNQSFDFLILGVGEDGHTASLFPFSKLVSSDFDEQPLVAFSENAGLNTTNKRMTLTFKAINQAKNIGILVLGEEKHKVLHDISNPELSPSQIPVKSVQSNAGEVVWYVDRQAWFGKQVPH